MPVAIREIFAREAKAVADGSRLTDLENGGCNARIIGVYSACE
jgi:hypothetical protein